MGIPFRYVYLLITLGGISTFIFIMFRRIRPLLSAAPDDRFDRMPGRIKSLLKIWLLQWRQPRYMFAGVLHILIFAGFIVLALRSAQMAAMGFFDGFTMPFIKGAPGQVYNLLKDYAVTWVFIAVIIAGIRRGVFRPARYAVPPRYGKDHTFEALFVLGFGVGLLGIAVWLLDRILPSAVTLLPATVDGVLYSARPRLFHAPT